MREPPEAADHLAVLDRLIEVEATIGLHVRRRPIRPDDAESHVARAIVAMFEKDHERRRIETEAAMVLNPNSGGSCVQRGGYLCDNGEAEAAIPVYEKAIRVDPQMTHLFLHHLATAYLHAERFETAAALLRSRILLAPRTDMSRAYLCVCLGHLGRLDEAREVWAELMAINPSYSVSERLGRFHFVDPAYPARVKAGLDKAGLPF
jgi:adenylate cyclase